MSDDATKTDPPAGDGNKDDGRDAAETEFWSKLTDNVGKIIDEKLAKIVPARTDNTGDGSPSTSGSRTGHRRTSISTLISDLVYGPPKDQ